MVNISWFWHGHISISKKKKKTNSIEAKVVKKNQINGFAKKCSTSITIEILEETNNSS